MLLVAHAHVPGESADASAVLLWLGGGLGVAAIPFYYAGYSRALSLYAPVGGWRRLIGLGAALVATFGAATHGLTAIDIHAALSAGHEARTPEEAFADWSSPLAICAWVAAAGALAAAAGIVVAGASSSLRALRIASLLNPVTWTIVLSALATASELSLAYLAPSAPNLAHFLFFALLARMTRFEQGTKRLS